MSNFFNTTRTAHSSVYPILTRHGISKAVTNLSSWAFTPPPFPSQAYTSPRLPGHSDSNTAAPVAILWSQKLRHGIKRNVWKRNRMSPAFSRIRPMILVWIIMLWGRIVLFRCCWEGIGSEVLERSLSSCTGKRRANSNMSIKTQFWIWLLVQNALL